MKIFTKTLLTVAAATTATAPMWAATPTGDMTFRIKPSTVERTVIEKMRGQHKADGENYAVAQTVAETPELMGCIFGSSAGNPSGLYRISTTAPEMTLLTDQPQATGGGTAGKGKYFCQWYLYMLSMDIWTNMVFNTTTWEWTGGIGQLESQAFDLAYDNATDRIYGCFFDPDENYIGRRLVFGWMDPDTYGDDYASVNPICDLFECFSGLAFDGAGQLFALTKEGILYQVDKLSGDRTVVGETGLTPEYNSSAAIDPATGLMYYFLCTEAETALYSIDTTTAQATKIYVLPGGEEVQGLAIFTPLAAQGAPSQASALSTTFADAELSGTVNFTIPAQTYDGAQGQGNVTYTISQRPYDNPDSPYTVLTTGTAAFGSQVQAPVTLPGNGQYSFGVVLSNDAGDAPMAVTDKYVGYDTPVSPYNLALSAEGNTLTLTWTPASGTLHNGYMDTDGLRYRIVRQPDMTVVAESHATTTFTETLPEPESRTRYTYTVETINHGMYSYPTTSPFVSLGHYTAPYVCEFESADEFAEYTVITKAESPDNYFHWEYNIGMHAAHLGNGRVADDDILISPAIGLTAGTTYEVKICMSNNSSSAATFALRAGDTASREAMGQYTLIDATEFTCRKPQTTEFTASFTPATSGNYHFGLHSLTPSSMWDDMYLHSLAVTSSVEDSVTPALAGDMTIIASTGRIIICADCPSRVTVAAASGMVMWQSEASAYTEISLPAGLYIIATPSGIRKVVVR